MLNQSTLNFLWHAYPQFSLGPMMFIESGIMTCVEYESIMVSVTSNGTGVVLVQQSHNGADWMTAESHNFVSSASNSNQVFIIPVSLPYCKFTVLADMDGITNFKCEIWGKY